MSLRIDFILDSEQRSGSLINPVFVLRLIGVLIPLVAFFFGGMAYLESRNLRNNLAGAEAEWRVAEPRYKAAQALQRDLANIRGIEAEINAWRNARHRWPVILGALREIVPPTIQLTQLQSEERLQLDGATPVRLFTLKIWGRARGVSPESDVELFRNSLLTHTGSVNMVRSAVIPRGSFGVDPAPDADRAHRVFQLHAPLYPMRFE